MEGSTPARPMMSAHLRSNGGSIAGLALEFSKEPELGGFDRNEVYAVQPLPGLCSLSAASTRTPNL